MREMPVLLLLVVGLGQPASAQEAGIEASSAAQALEAHRRRLMGRSALGAGRCDPASAPDEIVVCAPDHDQHRVGPTSPEPGERQRLIAGETLSAMSALEATACATGCSPRGQIDVIGGLNALRRGIGSLLDPDS